MSDKVIYDLLREVREDQKKDSEKISKTESCVERIQDDVKSVKIETTENTKHMGEHMRRCDLLEQLHADNQRRIEQLENADNQQDDVIAKVVSEQEFEKKVKNWFKDNLKYWLTIIGLIAGLVGKIFGLW